MTIQTKTQIPSSGTAVGSGPGSQARLPLLDVLRGAAILGTLMTNVWVFTAPGAEWGVLTGAVGTPVFDSVPHAVEASFRLLANGKFLALLTILFGVGLAIQYASAERRGKPWPGSYRPRAYFLFFEGTIHFVLIFAWDVLMGYAVTALLVAWLLTRSLKAQNRVMWWLGGVHVTLMLLATAALAAEDGGGTTELNEDVRELYASGSYGEQILFRLENALAMRMEPIVTFPLLVFLFLLGVRLFRAGAFGTDDTARRIRTRLLGWGLGLGLPISIVSTAVGPELVLVDRYIGGPLTALGYIGLIGLIVDRVRRPGILMTGLISVGRTALTGYVLQNLICMLAAYGIGLGLAETLGPDWSPWWVIALWAVVCAFLMTGATLWLRRFNTGPLESVQRWALRR